MVRDGVTNFSRKSLGQEVSTDAITDHALTETSTICPLGHRHLSRGLCSRHRRMHADTGARLSPAAIW